MRLPSTYASPLERARVRAAGTTTPSRGHLSTVVSRHACPVTPPGSPHCSPAPPRLRAKHPTPSLLQRRLCCRTRRFKPEPQGYILRVREPVGGVCLQGSQLPTSAECSRKAAAVAVCSVATLRVRRFLRRLR